MNLIFFGISNIEVTGDLSESSVCVGGVEAVVEVICELTSEGEFRS